jgi:hypothetical protein
MGEHQVIILLYEGKEALAGFVSVLLLLVNGSFLLSGDERVSAEGDNSKFLHDASFDL